MFQLYRERPLFVFTIAALNVCLSLWCFWLDPVINNDGVTYLAAAQQIQNGNWQTAFEYYSWPYYSIFIAGFAAIFQLSIETSAYILNGLFSISLTLAFISNVGELSNQNKRIILIAAAIILLFPSISKYRAFIIRDFGYLSFYLWSLYFIFRFCKTLKKGHLVAWLATAGMSCLFRFEGIVFMLIAPYFLLIFTNRKLRHRRTALISISALLFTTSAAVLIWFANDKYSALIEIARESGHDVNNLIDLFIFNLSTKIGGDNSGTLSYIGAISADFGNVGYELIRRMAVFYFIFAIYAYVKKIGVTNLKMRKIWLVYVLTNLALLLCFSIFNNFLVSRYAMATALTLLILAPFVIDQILIKAKNSTFLHKSLVAFMLIILAAVSLEGLDVRTSKPHFISAGKWLDNNIPKDASLYSNDRLLVYYAKLGPDSNFKDQFNNTRAWELLKSKTMNQYDYATVSVRPNNKFEDIIRSTLAYQNGAPMKIIEGPDGRAVFVFKVRH